MQSVPSGRVWNRVLIQQVLVFVISEVHFHSKGRFSSFLLLVLVLLFFSSLK